MMKGISVALAQVNLVVGDIDGNVARIIDSIRRARDELGARVVVFPELTLTGYPPEDLLFRTDFIVAAGRGLEKIVPHADGICVIVGYPHSETGRLYNAAAVLDDRRVIALYRKRELPNFGEFDEKRYFLPGFEACVVDVDDVRLGITICEDIWHDGPAEEAAARGAEIIVNLNASTYHRDKSAERERTIALGRARSAARPIVYVNLVGGQDELVFDGGSFVVDHEGTVVHRLPVFEEAFSCVEFLKDGPTMRPVPADVAGELGEEESVYRALVLGVRDYVEKNRFPGVVIGLSGGVDSALTLAIAVDALGANRVNAVLMPSRYTQQMSIDDAMAEANALEVECAVISIEPMFNAFLDSLAPVLADGPLGTTTENIQARIRGVLLMAYSNKSGRMVLTTGNKSEMAVGYATLYGDMAGGFAAIKDVPKTLVYRLARFRNTQSPVIPERVLERPPSAELAPDQRDDDSLPPYELLDPILEAYVEQHHSIDEIVSSGMDRDLVEKVVGQVTRNEYKRRQAAPGVKITQRAFGRDRRFPITSGFR